ncbi:alpha/beta hydrolase fold protein [Catenulispora acidiphila DSM 44928]|uniref:Alpha/beta hydrolase fold protein n=1 Tax=Catenulispora acidiphila (strain DSM 44928 / JCM 14897 / NBRC 102108 / NRRL B-24433 / ID139908) TaxID=479433 RepID=C7QCN7_CATAD|nr:alpha/beta hydrolase [Catenulispora acidiphila]ACU76500.1 alpha/beta hydrolase fold protein [Catenulispora acidiphila DSM 44928]
MNATHSVSLPDGGRLAYRDEGSGPLVVLLHGGFLDHRQWNAQLQSLPADFRTVAPDARGHGDSTVAAAPFRHTDDVAALIRHFDAGPAILVGVSMGAATATDTALEHPELVRALVVSGAGTSEPEFADGWTARTLAAIWPPLSAGDVAGALKIWNSLTTGPHRDPADLDPAIPALIAEMTAKTWAKHTDTKDWSSHAENTWARAAHLSIPLLAVIGGADSDDHRHNAERLAAGVTGARTVTIADAAHYPNMEHPEEFDMILTEFIDTLS